MPRLEAINGSEEESQSAKGSAQERVYGSPARSVSGRDDSVEGQEQTPDHLGNPDSDRQAPKRRGPKPGYVYIMGPYRGLYKIGQSVDPELRLRQMKLEGVCKIVHAIPDSYPLFGEQALHACFHHRYIGGEWFNLTRQDLRNLKKLASCRLEDLPWSIKKNHCRQMTHTPWPLCPSKCPPKKPKSKK